jgi:hypothetical protein
MQGKSKSGERIVTVSLKDGDRKYLSGHVVDGRNLFPAMGYIVSIRMQYVTDVVRGFQFIDMTLLLLYFPQRVVTGNLSYYIIFC